MDKKGLSSCLPSIWRHSKVNGLRRNLHHGDHTLLREEKVFMLLKMILSTAKARRLISDPYRRLN
jgi:hypothetical protein